MKSTLTIIAGITIAFFGLSYLGSHLADRHVAHSQSELEQMDAKAELNRLLQDSDIPPLAEDELVVVNVWATWCGPCIQEVPELNELAAQYGSQRVRFLAFSDEQIGVFDQFMEKRPDFQFDYELIWKNSEAIKFLQGYDRKNKGMAIPLHLMINRQGRVEDVLVGASPGHTSVLEDFIVRQVNPY